MALLQVLGLYNQKWFQSGSNDFGSGLQSRVADPDQVYNPDCGTSSDFYIQYCGAGSGFLVLYN